MIGITLSTISSKNLADQPEALTKLLAREPNFAIFCYDRLPDVYGTLTPELDCFEKIQRLKSHSELDSLETDNHILVRLLEDQTGKLPAFVPMPPAIGTEADLHTMLQAHFNWKELAVLAFRFGLNFDELEGDTLESRAQAVLSKVKQQGRLAEFTDFLVQHRPKVPWPVVPDQPDPHPGDNRTSRSWLARLMACLRQWLG